MTKVFLKKSLHLGEGTASRVVKPGEAILTDEEMASWFIPGLIAAGDIVVKSESSLAENFKELDYSENKVIFGGGQTTVKEIKPALNKALVPINKVEEQKEIIITPEKKAKMEEIQKDINKAINAGESQEVIAGFLAKINEIRITPDSPEEVKPAPVEVSRRKRA